MKRFTIIAGINGAGKTSLYHVLKNSEDLGERVNIDELAKKFGVMSIPTLVLLEIGHEKGTSVGYIPKEEVLEFLNK